MYSIKCKRGASDALMSDIIDLLSDAFYNIGLEIPPSFYEAKKIISKMGLNYIKIDAVCCFGVTTHCWINANDVAGIATRWRVNGGGNRKDGPLRV